MPDPTRTDVPVRDAATVILLRNDREEPAVLMGQRGKQAVFMPGKFVFPGGGLDAQDAEVTLHGVPSAICMARLTADTDIRKARGLLAAAIREVWEETGQPLARKDAASPAAADAQPQGWRDFFGAGYAPDASGLTFVFRAITPPGRPRRFDARFFLGNAALIDGDPDDFSRAQDELGHLQWVPLSKTRELDLPFITEVVLAEVQNRIKHPDTNHPVPFFSHDGDRSRFREL
ncbi:MAG: NUDIX hydrolase [Rhodobacteraceae bacterium]|nr:NUDIX hydrolase [Paracoccaceae bacterium]